MFHTVNQVVMSISRGNKKLPQCQSSYKNHCIELLSRKGGVLVRNGVFFHENRAYYTPDGCPVFRLMT
jgi:hypothetical protein